MGYDVPNLEYGISLKSERFHAHYPNFIAIRIQTSSHRTFNSLQHNHYMEGERAYFPN